MTEARLPLWRLITGFAMLAIFIGVLGALAPVYLENHKLSGYLHSLEASPPSQASADESLRAQVTARAHELNLPVMPGDVRISRTDGKLHLEAAYHVQMNLSLYAIDVHLTAR